jgi:hypothetical protein
LAAPIHCVHDHRHPTLYFVPYPIDIKDRFSYTPSEKKEVLINQFNQDDKVCYSHKNSMTIYPLEITRSLWHKIQRGAPSWSESSLLPLLFQLKDMVRLLFRPMLTTNEFFGPDGADGPKAIGVGLTPLAGLCSALLMQWPFKRPSCSTPFWRVRAAGFKKSADLVAVEGSLLLINSLPRQNALILPRCVSHTLDVTGEWQDVCRRFHKSIRNNELRWVRKYGYRFEKSTTTDHFEHFYERMYLPTVNVRHGSAAALTSKAKAYELFENGFLLRVFKDRTWVAGALCELRASGLRLCELGVLESNDGLIKQGTMAATYVAAIQTANNLKCRQIDLTVSASLLFNGTFQHKRRWGTSVSLPVPYQQRIWIKIVRYTPAIHRLLVMNPMITVDENGHLQALVALESLDRWDAAEVVQWRKHFFTPGLSSIRVIPLDRFRETGVLSFVTID